MAETANEVKKIKFIDNIFFKMEYIVVSETEITEPIELPTNLEDNTLNLQTLSRAFPNAHGLKYKNPKTGVFRALL